MSPLLSVWKRCLLTFGSGLLLSEEKRKVGFFSLVVFFFLFLLFFAPPLPLESNFTCCFLGLNSVALT